MKRVKIIYSQDYEIIDFETAINNFLESKEMNNLIDIKLTSEGAENGHSICAMIIYERL